MKRVIVAVSSNQIDSLKYLSYSQFVNYCIDHTDESEYYALFWSWCKLNNVVLLDRDEEVYIIDKVNSSGTPVVKNIMYGREFYVDPSDYGKVDYFSTSTYPYDLRPVSYIYNARDKVVDKDNVKIQSKNSIMSKDGVRSLKYSDYINLPEPKKFDSFVSEHIWV